MTEAIDSTAQELGTDIVPAAAAPQATLFRTDDPVEVVERASRVASALKKVLEQQRMIQRISNRDHVKVEGWTTLGAMLGVVPVVVWTRKLDNGWEARVEARTLDGQVIGAAEAECLKDESRWSRADDYALRSMAQTRATSKALRGPLGFVVTLAGYDATPAEELGTDTPRGNIDGDGTASPSDRRLIYERASGKLTARELLNILLEAQGVTPSNVTEAEAMKILDGTLTALRADKVPVVLSRIPES